jgi:FMN-dependent NADH-azoreductase
MNPSRDLCNRAPRGPNSVSRNLAARLLSDWRDANPQGQVVTRDLADMALPHLTMPWLAAYFTLPDAQTPEMKADLARSDTLVPELLAADELVISTPVYNYSVQSNLKAWIDHIVRKGLTLGFDGQGLLNGKKATIVIASGGVYGEGSPIADLNIAPHYLKLVLRVIGITDVDIIHGEGAKAVDLQELTMDAFVQRHLPDLRTGADA